MAGMANINRIATPDGADPCHVHFQRQNDYTPSYFEESFLLSG